MFDNVTLPEWLKLITDLIRIFADWLVSALPSF